MRRAIRIFICSLLTALLLSVSVFAETAETSASGMTQLTLGLVIVFAGGLLLLLFNTDRPLISVGGKYARRRR